MPFQSVNNVASFTALFAIQGVKRAQFSMYCKLEPGPWDSATLLVKATDLRDSIITDYIPVLSSDHDFIGVVGRDLEEQFGLVEEVIEPAAVPGAVGVGALPANVAVAATLKSSSGAPRRGRIFLLPPTEAQVTGDRLTAGAQGDLQDVATAFVAAMNDGASYTAVILSRFSGSALAPADARGQVLLKPTPRGTPMTQPITSVSVGSRTDSMRSRMIAESA